MARILVTGSAGFIGSHLTDHLLARGDEVVGLDNYDAFYDPAIKKSNLAEALQHPSFTFLEEDLRNRTGMHEVLREAKPDKVIHLAAMAGVRPSIERPQVYQEVNVGGTLNLLDAMIEVGCKRLVFGSTSSVYGASSKPPFQETDTADQPVSPYAATKRAAELLVYTYHHLHGLRASCLRFFTVYGPRQRPEMAIHRFARLMLAGEPIPMFGSGESFRDYTYVDDILDGVIKAADRDDTYGIYNLGESEMTTLRDLVQILGQALGVNPKIQQLDDQPGDVPATCADISKSKKILGYQPQVKIEEGIHRFVAWLKESVV